MLSEVSFVTFATNDLAAARAFYRDGLGWEPLLDEPGEIIMFQVAAGLVLALFDAAKFRQDLGAAAPADVPISGVILSHNVDSQAAVNAVVGRLIAAGGKLLKQPQQSTFGGVYHGHVQDPNGITWEIAHNPGWRVDVHGRVVLG